MGFWYKWKKSHCLYVYCFIAYNCDSIQQKWKNRHDGHTYAIWQIVFTYDAHARRDNVEADDYGLLFFLFIYFFACAFCL